MGEYINMDMLKSLVRTIELLTEENKELRKEIKELRSNYGYCTQLTDEQKEKFEMAWKNFKEGK
jgi:predicted  nucleic acid-binding Zn-ribbon protein